jgi:3-hydroxyisobutyrate dehydrogenase-like beta-hydroxyacid dehydrogenase
VFGDRGALSVLRRDAIHISMSTISVALSDHLTGAHGNAGQGYVAAPVFGRPEAAAAAKRIRRHRLRQARSRRSATRCLIP